MNPKEKRNEYNAGPIEKSLDNFAASLNKKIENNWQDWVEIGIAFSGFFMWLMTFWMAGYALIIPQAINFEFAGYQANGFGVGIILLYINRFFIQESLEM